MAIIFSLFSETFYRGYVFGYVTKTSLMRKVTLKNCTLVEKKMNYISD